MKRLALQGGEGAAVVFCGCRGWQARAVRRLDMRLRRLLVAGSLVVTLLSFLVLSIVGLRERTVAVSMGVAGYVRQTNELLAYITLTNQGGRAVAVPLRYGCEVEMGGGWTNYTAETRYTIFLQPEQRVVFSSTDFAVRLPLDARTWSLKLQVRPQTRREWLLNSLHQWGVETRWRVLSGLHRPPAKDETFSWTECQSGVIEVPRRSSAVKGDQ